MRLAMMGRSTAINLVVGIAMAGFLGLSVGNAMAENDIRNAASAIRDPIFGVEAGGSAIDPPRPARLALLESYALARKGADTPLPARNALLDRADFVLAGARAQRHDFAQATLVEAYIRGVRNGSEDPAIAALVGTSYRESPFLREEGEWRIQYAVDHWSTLDPELRHRVVEEAVWLGFLSKPDMVHIELIFLGTPAFAQYQKANTAPPSADDD